MTAQHRETAPSLVRVTARGRVPHWLRAYAVEKVGAAARVSHATLLDASVVLEVAGDPARQRPALAEAALDLDGTQVRAKTAATTLQEAVDELEDRLRRQVVQLQDRVRTRSRWTGLPEEHGWRHGNLPSTRADAFPRPPEQRELVRRKTFALAPMTVDEAAYEMDLLGHDFYLFVEVVSGADALVHRAEGGAFVVVGAVLPQPHPAGDVRYDGEPPTLRVDQARERLDAGGEPFVFYRDAASGRGHVLYLRYDGHYGLITPAADAHPL